MAQLYAFCRENGNAVIKHVQLNAALQNGIQTYFEALELVFMEGIQFQLPFTGDWKPDDDELLVVIGLAEAQAMLDASALNAVALPVLNVANFANEGIKALFTSFGNGAARRLLVQNFSPQQILSTKFTMLHDGNVFRQVQEPAFSLERSLVAIVASNGDLKFKSFVMARRVFDLSPVYKVATDAEVLAFCGHASLSIADANAFLAGADEGIRKHVHTIAKLNLLGQHPVPHIQNRAVQMQFPLNVVGGQIEVPADRKRTKELLSFLLDKVYRGSLDPRLFITNSNRPL